MHDFFTGDISKSKRLALAVDNDKHRDCDSLFLVPQETITRIKVTYSERGVGGLIVETSAARQISVGDSELADDRYTSVVWYSFGEMSVMSGFWGMVSKSGEL